ncbi:MAG TPA: hypothetical protein PKZ42_06665 [Syntrophales bacterium]|nr:hypothetical protein [Syntrophales bacterium]
MSTDERNIGDFLEKIKSICRNKYVISLCIIFASIAFILYPLWSNNISIKITTKKITLNLPNNFRECSINFKHETFVFFYAMRRVNSNNKNDYREKRIEQNVKTLTLKNLYTDKLNLDQYDDSEGFRIIINTKNQLYSPTEIINVTIDGQQIDLKEFFDNYILSGNKTYEDRRYIRESLALLLLKYNDSISNYILTIFTLFFLVTVTNLLFNCKFILLSNVRFERYINEKYFPDNGESLLPPSNIVSAKDNFGMHYVRKDNWLRFLQVLGPAVGFTLTISSLIAALHPSIRELGDIGISSFFEAIQIAMISTFVGLLIRLTSILHKKLNDKILIRADIYFFKIENSINNQTPVLDEKIIHNAE